jgi:hypothetical protein
MLQPSLLSGPERFALGGGRSGSLCIISELYVCCGFARFVMYVVFTFVAGCRQQYGTCSPAYMFKSSLTSSFIYACTMDNSQQALDAAMHVNTTGHFNLCASRLSWPVLSLLNYICTRRSE